MSDKDIGRLTDSVFTGKKIQNNSNDNLYFKELNQNQNLNQSLFIYLLEVYATLFRSSNNGTATQATFNDSTISLCGIVINSLKAS